MNAADIFNDDSDEAEELREVRNDLWQCIDYGVQVWDRQEQAKRVRYCQWEGQSLDGRKHSDSIGTEAAPFEGASDARVPLLDGVINEKVALTAGAFFRAQVQATPVEPGDAPQAAAVSNLLRCLRDVKMRDELEVEVELSAQYMFGDDPGACVVAIDWLRDTRLVRKVVTFDELAGMYATGARSPQEVDFSTLDPQLLGDFHDLATNPLREREFTAWLASAFPAVSARLLKKAGRVLRTSGEAELAVPEVRQSRPTVTTLKLWDEIFFPLGTIDLQRARNIHRREWLSETELRERVATMGWDAEVVEDIIENGKGKTIADGHWLMQRDRLSGISPLISTGKDRLINERQNLFEIWWSYERRVDEMGIAGIWCMQWNIHCAHRFLKAELYAGPDGFYPFVLGTRERVGRQVTDSRGLTNPLSTFQGEVKTQHDARSNYTQLVASPPRKQRLLAGTLEVILGPNASIPVQRMDDFEMIQMPPFMAQSVEIERTVKEEVAEYAGRQLPNTDPNRVALLQQHDVNAVFRLWRSVFTQILSLCTQYYTPAELERIVGAPLDLDALRGGFDLALEIDARDLNMDYAMKKLDAYTKLVGLDASGGLDRGGLVEWGATSFDPILAKRTLRPQEQVTQKMIDEEQSNVAKMAVGIEPHMPEQGLPNPQLRLQTMAQTIQQSQHLSQLYGQSEGFKALVENRAKFLSMQVKQDQNKTIGRLGTAPLQTGGGMLGGM